MVIFVQYWRVICGEYCVVVLLYHVHTVNKCGRDPTHGFEVEMSRVYPYIRSTFENSKRLTCSGQIYYNHLRNILFCKASGFFLLKNVGNASAKVGDFFLSVDGLFELPKLTFFRAAFFRLCLGASVFAFLSRVYIQMPSLSPSAPIACVGGWHFPKGKVAG